jgi:hypothetical protein
LAGLTRGAALLSPSTPLVVTQVVRETQRVVQSLLIEVTATPAPASSTPEGPPEVAARVNTLAGRME